MTTPTEKSKCDPQPGQRRRQQRAKDLMDHLERMDPQVENDAVGRCDTADKLFLLIGDEPSSDH